MFKGIQHTLQRNLATKKAETATPVTSTTSFLSPTRKPILSAAELLLTEQKRINLINKFPDQLGFNNERFELYARSMLNNFAEFVQNLPETRNSYYAQEGGFIDHALERTSIALELCRSYCLADESENGSLSEPQLLWMYVIYSASLLIGIGRIIADFHINLYDQKGRTLSHWQALHSNMLKAHNSEASFYEYEFKDDIFEGTFRQRLTVLLAQQLMPAEGLQWLSTDLEALSIWLALLEEDTSGNVGILGQILMQADAVAIRQYLEKLFALKEFKNPNQRKYSALSVTFKTNDIPAITNPNEIGLDALRWITQQIESGKLVIGQAPLVSVAAGVILSKEVFQLFVRANPEYQNWQAVQAGVLGLLGNDAQLSQTTTPASGILLKKVQLISSNSASANSAIQTRIAADGSFVAPPPPKSTAPTFTM